MLKNFIAFVLKVLVEMGFDLNDLVSAFAQEKGYNARQVRDLQGLVAEFGMKTRIPEPVLFDTPPTSVAPLSEEAPAGGAE